MIWGRMSPGLLGTCATLLVFVQASPLLRFPRESEDYPNNDFSNYTANEVCFSDQRVFQRGEEVPNAGPCEECRCEPPSIVCQMTKCPVNNNGCRTIQRPNHCCPDYNCECDYNGQLYNDGERIDLPEDPCQVCYCKGGDVMCTSITCYHRDDCEPKHVPGQCCPKYEDCPIRDMEASNTDEKNVQTRSPNKTMISNPKKEIQPWLLTKSVPQTSSSLAIPKVGETTTDSGNIIIVSDWLVEQKTTEDFKTKQTEDPVLYNHQEPLGTTQSPKLNQSFENDRFEIKSETVRPTPIEEVVFTRIDLPKRIQEEIIDFQTTTAADQLEKSDSIVSTISETHDSKISLENVTKTQLLNSTPNATEVKSIALKKNDKLNSSFSPSLNDTTENESMITTSPLNDKNLSTQEKKESEMIEPIKHITIIKTQTPQLFKEVINNESENNINKNKTVLKNQPPSSKYPEDKDSKPEEITLDHLFGFDTSDESTKEKPKEEYNADYLSTLSSEKSDTIDTTDPTKDETVFTHSTKNSYKDINFKPLPEMINVYEISEVANNASSDIEQSANMYRVPITASENLEENVTTFTPEVSTNKLLLQAGKFVLETNQGDEETTYLPESTTYTGISAMPDMTISNQLTNETKKKLSNVIETNQNENPEYTETDQTTVSNTDSTSPVTTESSQSTTQEFIPERKIKFNEGISYGNRILETTLNSHITKINDYLYSTPATNGFEETTKYKLSEIEIILDETNDKIMIDTSNSQESIEQDGVVLKFNFDEVSSENKEVMMNHPPVLELNSHVPFLQIGGNGNSESSDIEYGQTTIVNKPDYHNSFSKDKIQEEKYTTNLNDEHTTNPPLDTLNNTLSLASLVEINKRKNNDNKKNVSNDKVDEMTIPTIAVVPLTPGDLKTIAEYLISEKIKPVTKETNTTPNKWLKGNLTSENNIESILSAANVSIGLMNQTNIGRMFGKIKISDQNTRLEKHEKESQYKSNSNILQNKYTVTSKTDYLHDKSSDDQQHIKSTSSSPYKISDMKINAQSLPHGIVSDGVLKTTKEPIDEIFTVHELKNIQSMKPDEVVKKSNDMVSSQKNKSDVLFEIKPDFVKLDLQTSNEAENSFHKDISQNETLSRGDINENVTSVNLSKTEKLIIREKNVSNEKAQVIPRFPVANKKTSEYYHTVDDIATKTSANTPYNTSELSTS